MSRLTAPERVGRLLSIVPWIAEQPEPVPLADIAERFSYPIDYLQRDLCEMVPCVGTWPRDPYDLIDLILDDEGCVSLTWNNHFTAPLRLTPSQALVLIAAAAAVSEDVGDSTALKRGLDKLATALGVDVSTALNVQLGGGDSEIRTMARDAAVDGGVLRIDYYSHGRDTRTERSIEPLAVRAEGGAWYVLAWCRLAEGFRRFRVERISSAERTGERFEPRELPVDFSLLAEESLPTVTLDVPLEARWVAEHAVVRSITETADSLRLTIPVGATAWLERLLLQLGASATMVAIDEPLTPTLGAEAAQLVLDRYRP